MSVEGVELGRYLFYDTSSLPFSQLIRKRKTKDIKINFFMMPKILNIEH